MPQVSPSSWSLLMSKFLFLTMILIWSLWTYSNKTMKFKKFLMKSYLKMM